MLKSIRRFVLTLPLALPLSLCAWHPMLQAEAAYPSRPITLVVPYPPGGTNDNVARIISKRLSEKTAQPVVLDYKGGAGGTIGAAFVAGAEADGYTLLNTSIGNVAIAPLLMKVKFDPFVDLVPVAYVGNARATVAVNPALPFQNLEQLITYAKANPGKLTFGSSGNGTPGHLAGELLKAQAGIDLRHVPYKGSAAAVADVVAGHVDIAFDPLSTSFIKAGKLRALAYFGGPTPPAELPDVPHIQRAGVRQWEEGLAGSFFITAPRRTPAPVLAHLRTLLNEVLREPATVEALARVQVVAEVLSPEQTERQIRAVSAVAQRVIQAGGVQAN